MAYEIGESVTAFDDSDNSVDLKITGLDEQTGVANTVIDAEGNVYIYMNNNNNNRSVFTDDQNNH